MRTETVGFCFVWSKGVMKPSAFVLCDGKVYWNCQVLSYVQGRRTWSCRVLCCVVGSCSEAVGSCVVWWEGVLKPSGVALCGGKAHWSCHVLCCVVQRRGIAVGSCVVWWEGVLTPSRVLRCVQGRRTEAVGTCTSLPLGLELYTEKAHWSCRVLSCVQGRRLETVGSCVSLQFKAA